MFKILPEDDPKQALRIRRFFMATGSYILWIGLVIYLAHNGFSRLSLNTVCKLIILALIVNMVFFIIFRTGINKRFKDPSLTMPQMMTAIFWAILISYFTDEARGSLLLLFPVVFVFGMFSLKLSQYLFLTSYTLISYCIVIILLSINHMEIINFKIEIVNLILLATVLPWYSLIGSNINNLRQRLKESKKTIEQLAIHDELTNVFNRRQMFIALQREMSIADRGNTGFSICILDVDHFKSVNDMYGHLIGDMVLKTLAQEIKLHLRESDYIARYGGEEFVLILNNHDPDEAIACAERIRRHIESFKFSEDVRITISIGVTMYNTGESIDSTLDRSDKALYQAKTNGRNRIEHIFK